MDGDRREEDFTAQDLDQAVRHLVLQFVEFERIDLADQFVERPRHDVVDGGIEKRFRFLFERRAAQVFLDSLR
jgi:hypothetical protein